MVRDAGGNITYVNLEQLIPYDKEKGRLAKVAAPQIAPEPEEEAPKSVVPIEDTRLNLNTAPPEQIAKRLPGVGYATAKRIVELRMSPLVSASATLSSLRIFPVSTGNS